MKLKPQDIEDLFIALEWAYQQGKADAYDDIIEGLAEKGLEIWEVGEERKDE